MTMRLIPHAAAVSEFIAGYNGDCGETAEMALLHVINPSVYPLNAADLSTIVKRDITHGWASSNGSEPISAIAHDLDTLGLHYTNYGYAEPFTADWRSLLAQWGGIKPIIFEYGHAGLLPGDEAGVAYHFNTCLGWDPAASSGLFADGDNLVEREGGTALVTYTEAELATAGLCGMLVGEYELGGVQMAVPAGWSDDGTTLKAPNGVPVVHGMREYVLTHTWDPGDTPMAAESYPSEVELGNTSLGGGATQFFKISGQLSWTQARGVFKTWDGQEEYALHAALKAAQDATAAAQANVTAMQGQRDALSAQLATAQQQITQLQQQVQQLQNQPPAPAPAPAPAPQPPSPQTQAALLLVKALQTALASSSAS